MRTYGAGLLCEDASQGQVVQCANHKEDERDEQGLPRLLCQDEHRSNERKQRKQITKRCFMCSLEISIPNLTDDGRNRDEEVQRDDNDTDEC